jgi:UDP-glucose 4-epimerase
LKALITGGSGFIGLHCVEKLLQEGMSVVVVDNLTSGSAPPLPENSSFYKANIEDPELGRIFAKEQPDYVIHLAAQISVKKSLDNPYNDCLSNIAGTVNLLQNCRKYHVKKIIFASSAAVYGEPDYLPIDEAHPQKPISFYSLSKLTAEKYVQLFLQYYGISYCILRFANVYGPGQNAHGEAGVISIFLKQLSDQQTPTLYGGEQTRDFVYVKDVAEAVFLSLNYEKNETFNISTNTQTKITELLNTLKNELKSSINPVHQQPRDGDILHSVLDNTLVMNELKWKNHYSLQEGLRETIQYFKSKK